MQRLEIALKVHFALLAALGGLMMGLGDPPGPLPVIAVIASAFSLVAVDLLKLFALPPLAAYLGMAGVAVYCISDFLLITPQDNQQLVAVAQLLVLVLAVLQMQRKSRRVFEQIGIFCLLELVVGAVFNNALVFAMMVIPFTALGLSALVLLQIAAVAEAAAGFLGGGSAEWTPPRKTVQTTAAARAVRTAAPDSAAAISAKALWLPGLSLATLSPSIVLIAAFFFYALPRTMPSASSSAGGGQPQVGYSETLSLKQMGRMLQDPTPVMRVRLFDRQHNSPYISEGPLYLRGAVLDSYELAGSSGIWRCMQVGKNRQGHRVPAEPQPRRASDAQFFDSVGVEITTQPLSTVTLFAIAPYHSIEHSPDLFHTLGNWTLSRGDSTTQFDPRRLTYRIGTNAFRDGVATRYLRVLGEHEAVYVLPDVISRRPEARQPFWTRRLTQFDPEVMPTVQTIADELVARLPPGGRSLHAVCLRFEQYLQRDAGLRYTTSLTHDQLETMDPVEQFLTVDRAGHCQFFASTLAMMLRSQGIPARVVVGYKSGEFNALGQQYVVRQSHAHAWVEALLEQDDLPTGTILYGQPPHGPVWMRLDGTPRGSTGMGNDSSNVSHVVDFAQSLWERYVLDMDSERQNVSLYGTVGGSGLASYYTQMVGWGRSLLMRIPFDAQHIKTLSERSWGPVAGAAAAVFLALGLGALWRLGTRTRRSEWLPGGAGEVGRRPEVDFVAQAYDQLARLGMLRRPSQTPREFALAAAKRLGHPALPAEDASLQFLTQVYYGIRFGASPRGSASEDRIQKAITQLTQAVDLIVAEQPDRR